MASGRGQERFTPNVDLNVYPIEDHEFRQAGLNILDSLPDQDDEHLATEYIQILQSLGFDEE